MQLMFNNLNNIHCVYIIELKGHPLFSKIDWHNVHDVVPKFIPSPEDDEDTSYFDG
jgi:hypothetical protein